MNEEDIQKLYELKDKDPKAFHVALKKEFNSIISKLGTKKKKSPISGLSDIEVLNEDSFVILNNVLDKGRGYCNLFLYFLSDTVNKCKYFIDEYADSPEDTRANILRELALKRKMLADKAGKYVSINTM